MGKRLYRYELVNDELINPELLLDLPARPGSKDNGDSVLIDPDNNIYSVTCHITGDNDQVKQTKAQSFVNGPDADGTSWYS